MSIAASLSPDVVLRNYFHAKDENRPHILERVFSQDATLEVHNRSDAITFPATTSGRDEIANVLVRSFSQTSENVYSFYLQRPHGPLPEFNCAWLVAMTDKNSRSVRVGCGVYAWEFDAAPPNLARRLEITILEMQVLPPATANEVFSGLEDLSYPWSSPAEVEALASTHPAFGFVCEHTRRDRDA